VVSALPISLARYRSKRWKSGLQSALLHPQTL